MAGVVNIFSAEVSTLLPHPADVNRYSKDHINPDPIAAQEVVPSPYTKEIQSGNQDIIHQFPDFSYDYYEIDAKTQIRALEILTVAEIEAEPEYMHLKDIICCRIKVLSFEHDNFDALSYTWGPLDRIPIAIVPSKSAKSDLVLPRPAIFNATRQLYAAFSALRQQGPRTIWVDQICINQADDATGGEKVKQLGLMDVIYDKAQQTVIWLGLEDETTPALKSLLQKFEMRGRGDSAADRWVEENIGRDGARTQVQEGNYYALIRLLNREWFSRAWIFQEAALSKNPILLCGTTELRYDEVVKLVRKVYQFKDRISGYTRSIIKRTVGFNTLDLIKDVRAEKFDSQHPSRNRIGRGKLLETLTLLLQHLQATKPQDLINTFISVVYQRSEQVKGQQKALAPFAGDISITTAWSQTA
jgi:hypothetical protein